MGNQIKTTLLLGALIVAGFFAIRYLGGSH